MKLTLKESKTLLEHLPIRYKQVIADKLKEQGKEVSQRWIYAILTGEVDDNYGVIEIATEIAVQEKQKQKSIKNKLNQL